VHPDITKTLATVALTFLTVLQRDVNLQISVLLDALLAFTIKRRGRRA
jgi:hypothetical protein